MPDRYNLFFELIRVALGTQESISFTPTEKEWKQMYNMAKKHSIVGICYVAIQRLPDYMRPSEMLYLTWMGLAAKIQQRNELMIRRCVELQQKLEDSGFKCCFLKGQSNHPNYGNLAMLRQSGDIDVWLYEDITDVLKLVHSVSPTDEINETHVHFHIFEDAEVELHFVPAILSNKIANIKLQKWLRQCKDIQFANYVKLQDGTFLTSPTKDFNLVYQLIHIYRHLFSEGIGLRQLIDYYFVLQSIYNHTNFSASTGIVLDDRIDNAKEIIHRLGLDHFASALMWILGQVFGLRIDSMPWVPSKKEGVFLLNEIMQMGNFGYSDNRFKLNSKDSHIKRYFQMVSSKCRFLEHFPSEVLWQPVAIFVSFYEIRCLKIKYNRLINS